MSDLEVISFRPEAGQYAWTFGGVEAVRRVRTPAVLEVFTEDCFAGRVRGAAMDGGHARLSELAAAYRGSTG